MHTFWYPDIWNAVVSALWQVGRCGKRLLQLTLGRHNSVGYYLAVADWCLSAFVDVGGGYTSSQEWLLESDLEAAEAESSSFTYLVCKVVERILRRMSW